MDGMISFAANGAGRVEAGSRHLAAASAMRRYVPHVVAWRWAEAGGPISVTLPESLSARELLRRAEHERIELGVVDDPTAPDRVFEIHYAHLAEDEIAEGIRRLGDCLVRYWELAARHMPGQASTLVGT